MIACEAVNERATLAADWFESVPELVDAMLFAHGPGLCGQSASWRDSAGNGARPSGRVPRLRLWRCAASAARSCRSGVVAIFRKPSKDASTRWTGWSAPGLKRLLNKGRRDGSLALRNLDSACELILASLQAPDVAVDGPEQRMWDSELVELLLAALSEPHPPADEASRSVAVAHGACLCGTVRYELNGPLELNVTLSLLHVPSASRRAVRDVRDGAAHGLSLGIGRGCDLRFPVICLRQTHLLREMRLSDAAG